MVRGDVATLRHRWTCRVRPSCELVLDRAQREVERRRLRLRRLAGAAAHRCVAGGADQQRGKLDSREAQRKQTAVRERGLVAQACHQLAQSRRRRVSLLDPHAIGQLAGEHPVLMRAQPPRQRVVKLRRPASRSPAFADDTASALLKKSRRVAHEL